MTMLHPCCRRNLLLLLAALTLLTWSNAAMAQPKAAPMAQDKYIVELEVETSDNVLLFYNYYKVRPKADAKEPKPASEAPVVLIIAHEKGNKQDYDALARDLQNAGNAVIVPDLRGTGKSNKRLVKKVEGGQVVVGKTMPVTATRPEDFLAMAEIDLEKIKTEMVKLHNAGEFNIRRLCVIGVESGTVLALNWALLKDWSWPDLTTGPQAKDVRGLVLISPRWNHKGLIINKAIEQGEFIKFIPTLLMVGAKDNNFVNDDKRLYDQFDRYLPLPANATPMEKMEQQKLFDFRFDTTLQGFKLVNEKKLTLPNDPKKTVYDPAVIIKYFIESRVANNEFKWSER
jgi:alpha-beta hydrolase superfamily lysophospholipase